ncbi:MULTISPECIES: site-specific integrase [unclassified Ruegeria]|uniref:tyrosine-type recombinase/integrase n=1 Tax=unclassified Ruegeria TaxID=2625375 RepID=UPI0014924A91|nr:MULTISPECIES: site-specific integrase [unclassified Ruegeria]NOD48714.1 tyrosine-type recombinase/integrase [Ruegeria sp. HKCCD5849]NOD51984.1 tyrosine-type recombinase/integrase [Ruegeria sp. HKCCD5851]NOD66642.1 tyrosine-type recombinase/integrase [Ruegeria sp. HKCCD7303]
MTKAIHTPDLSCLESIFELPVRRSPYWNILEYCRHIGVKKLSSAKCHWMARIRRIDGKYSEKRIGEVAQIHRNGLDYGQALTLAKAWFDQPDIKAIASQPYAVGVNSVLKYEKTSKSFTVGDAMNGFVEWKRIAAAKTYFETTLSLINHHIIPRLGDLPVRELSQSVFLEFCTDVLETAPKRGNQTQGDRTRIEDLDHEQLRKRKKTLNTVIGILRTAIEMSWENGDVESERLWRRLRRIPHADTPRQFFLTRAQAKRLIASCRPDLALLVQGALYTGCRVSELAQLKARDVGGHVFGIFVAPLKSYRGRYVVLPDEGMSFFLDQISELDDEELVFRMSSGKAWSGCHKHLFKEAVRRAGLPAPFVFHGLRHTYASQLVQAGTPLAVVAKQLGHTNTDTVSRTYGHLCCDTIEAEISRRFSPLQKTGSDPRLLDLRKTLQGKAEPIWSWPRKNRSKASGDVVSRLRAKEEELRLR